jgi:4-hydroxybenzoate polyprenyltransferase
MKTFLIKICDCFFLLRIFLLVPVWTTIILGWITSYNNTRVGGFIFNGDATFAEEEKMWIALIGFSFIVAAIFVINQITDVESDRINKKLFILPNGLISIRTAWICCFLCAIAGLLISLVFFDSIMFIMFLLGLILGVMYSLPPFNLKNTAIGGTTANFIGHGMITYLVGWYAAKYGNKMEYSAIMQGIIASCTLGFAHAAVFLTTTIPDTKGDKSIGKNTFCVLFGAKKTAITSTVFCGFALLFSFSLEYNRLLMIVQSAVSLLLFISFAINTKSDSAFKTFRWPVFLLTALVAIYIPLYGIITFVNFFICRIYYKLRFNYTYPTFVRK